MKILIKATVIALALSFTTLYAGSSHTHGGDTHSHDAPQKEVSKASIEKIVKQEIKRLALAKKIDNSWSFVPISKMKKKKYNNSDEWAVVLDNSKIQDKTKQRLYIFVSVYGNITGVNYTGN